MIYFNIIIFKTLISFLVIPIYVISKYHFPLIPYVTGIRIKLNCTYSELVFATVYISEKPHIFKEKHPIAKKFSIYGFGFSLIGALRRIKRPRLFVKIFHRCSKKWLPIDLMIIKEIPGNFIYRGRKLRSLYNLGQVELSKRSRSLSYE